MNDERFPMLGNLYRLEFQALENSPQLVIILNYRPCHGPLNLPNDIHEGRGTAQRYTVPLDGFVMLPTF